MANSRKRKVDMSAMGQDEKIELLSMAKRMYDAWGEMYEKNNGGRRYSSAVMSDLTQWLPYAVQARDAGATPEDWVYAQFKAAPRTRFTTCLSGDNAYKNWKQFAKFVKKDTGTSSSGDVHSALSGQVMSRIVDLQYMLVAARFNDDLRDIRTRKFVLTRLPGFLDALAVIIMSPDDEMWEVYGNQVVTEFPEGSGEAAYLVKTLYELDLALAAEYLSWRLCVPKQ